MEWSRLLTVSSAVLMALGLASRSLMLPALVGPIAVVLGMVCARLSRTPLRGMPRLKAGLTVLSIVSAAVVGSEAGGTPLPQAAITVAAILGLLACKLSEPVPGVLTPASAPAPAPFPQLPDTALEEPRDLRLEIAARLEEARERGLPTEELARWARELAGDRPPR